ncbi:MAG TPA: peptide MFS transporter [Bacteroidia bacterium]|jgi:POT family proton-dependent oligopeptide transporter|nr:peptide MFS transporter [Bacteroidia bacterium]HQF28723.1 peptide MFS transporter [Bacteroidia bacterium]
MSKKHPSGLPYLFFAEMWERFGYYLMIGIFVLYMTDTQKGGLAMDRATATDIFGTFIALVFLTPFIGGLLADRVLGLRKAITIGGLLMGLGYMGLALPGMTAFYTSLLLIIVGNGFFKPNISTLLGNLYNEKEYKDSKDSGYNIFYMGINIGAFICNFFAAYLRHNYGWGFAFMGAGVGMFIGVAIFWIGMRHYRHADVKKPVKPEDMSLARILGTVILPAFIAGIVGWMIPGAIFGTDSTDAFIFGSLPVLVFYFSLFARASKEDRQPIGALLAIFAVVIIFWAIFKQNGTALTTWAEFYTDRSAPALIEGPMETLKMSQHVTSEKDSFPIYDNGFRTTKVDGKVVKGLTQHPYLINVPQEKHPIQGQQLNLVSTELYQSINPFFVVVLTPVVVAFFRMLNKKGKEPKTPAKIAWGLVISALSTLVMVAAVYYCHNGAEKASPLWLFGCYGVVTFGELFLSPMGLSLVSKLSPPRLTAVMMGGWFLATSIGNKLSGVLAGMWDGYEHKASFFLVNFVLLAIAAAIIFSMLKWLNRVFSENT